jgi:hypothetical protein
MSPFGLKTCTNIVKEKDNKMQKTFEVFYHCLRSAKVIGPPSQYNDSESANIYISKIKSPAASYVAFHLEDEALIKKLKAGKIPYITFQSEKFKGDFDAFAKRNGFMKEGTYLAHVLSGEDLLGLPYFVIMKDNLEFIGWGSFLSFKRKALAKHL